MIRGLLAVSAATVALAGCSGLVTVYEPNYTTQGYYDGALELAASKGEMHTEIEGDLFGMPNDQFDATVTRLMKGANFGPPVVYSTKQSDKTLKAFKVVMVFNGPLALSVSDTCADKRKPIQTSPAGNRVRLRMVFCQFERPLSESGGSVSHVKGPDDPKFRELVRQTTAALFPTYDHRDNGIDSLLMP